MNVPQLEIADALLQRARAAYVRLRDQTLWGAHPASFYESALQELMVLAEFGVASLYELGSAGAYRVVTRSIEWTRTSIDDADSKSRVAMVEGDALMATQTSPIVLKPSVVTKLFRHDIEMQLIVQDLPKDGDREVREVDRLTQSSSAGGPPRHPQVVGAAEIGQTANERRLQDLLQSLLSDLSSLFPTPESSLFSLKLQAVVERTRTLAEEKYKSAAQRPAHVQIMLYHPGVQPGDSPNIRLDFDGKTRGPDLGYLFYPVFDVPKEWSWSSRGHRPSQPLASELEQGVSTATVTASIGFLNAPKATKLLEEHDWLRWCVSAVDEAQRTAVVEYIEQHVAEFLSLLERISVPTVDVDADTAFGQIATRVLAYAPDHLVTSLLQDGESSAPGSPSRSPVVFQPRGLGPAGQVARDLVTLLVRRVSAQSIGSLSRREGCLPYYFMGLLEAEWGVREDYSGIVTPLLGKGQLLGVLVAYRPIEEGMEFTDSDGEFFESIASHAGKMIQEAKDHLFARFLRRKWFTIFHPLGGNWPEAFDKWLEELGKRLPFVMNAVAVWRWEALGAATGELKPVGVRGRSHTFSEELVPTPILRALTDEAEDDERGSYVRFCRWYRDAGAASFCHRTGGMTDVVLRVTARGPDSIPGKDYLLQVRLQEPPEVFVAHKEEMEIFLDHCLSHVNDAVGARELDHGETA